MLWNTIWGECRIRRRPGVHTEPADEHADRAPQTLTLRMLRVCKAKLVMVMLQWSGLMIAHKNRSSMMVETTTQPVPKHHIASPKIHHS